MKWKIIKKVVFDSKPELKNIIFEHGHKTVFEYIYSRESNLHQENGHKHELLSVVQNKVEKLFGAEVAEKAIAELSESYYVSTADHHGPLTHAFFFNNTWVQAISNISKGKKFLFTFACSGISLNNSSFPRGFLIHNSSLEEKRLHLFSLKNRHQPVYLTKSFEKSVISKLEKEIVAGELDYKSGLILKILNKSFLRTEVLESECFSDQICKGNYYLWKLFPGQAETSLIYLNQEEIVKDLILKFHLVENTEIYNLLFNNKFHESFQRSFDGIIGAFSKSVNSGTFLFWGLKNDRRVSLVLKDGKLINEENNISILLTPDSIFLALNDRLLMPSMALTFIVLSFYYGLVCGGGFSQVNYLGDLKKAWRKVLFENNIKEPNFLNTLPTNYFAGEMSLSFISNRSQSVAATSLDVLLYGENNCENNFESICKSTSLEKAIDTMMPEYYKIITGKNAEIKPLKLKPFLFISSNFSNLFAPKKCTYCGNNPVPHNVQWVSESMLIAMSPLNRAMARVGIFKMFSRLLDKFFMVWWKLFEKFNLVGFHGNRETWTIDRAKVLWEEAEKKGIEMKGARFFGKEIDFYQAIINGKKIFFSGLPRPQKFKDSEIEFWLDDKAIIKQKLSAAEVPVSRGGSFSNYKKLREHFYELQKPVIIKPRLGSRGRHTSTAIYTEDQLKKAFKIAKQLCHWVIVEEHLVGDVFRGTVIGGKLVGVLGGSPPRIIGDGVHKIGELIELKNAAKDPRIKDFKATKSSDEFLARNSLTFESVLPKGKVVDLTEKIGISYGGSSYEITEETHPEIKAALEKAAATIGDPLLGFDFIVDDVTVSPQGKKWGIIECNGMPFINLHHHPLIGKPNPVGKFVWDLHI